MITRDSIQKELGRVEMKCWYDITKQTKVLQCCLDMREKNGMAKTPIA